MSHTAAVTAEAAGAGDSMRLTESKLRRIIRRAIMERMGSSYAMGPELELLQQMFEDPGYTADDIRHLTYRVSLGRKESIEVQDNVIHAGHPPVVIDNALARASGTSIVAFLEMLEAHGARRVR